MFPAVSSSYAPGFPNNLSNRPPVRQQSSDTQQDNTTPPLHAAQHTLSEQIQDKIAALGDDAGSGISKGLETLQQNAVHFIA
jgi:hypothetical protein